MAYRTFGDLKTQVELELDLEEETFIQPNEMLGYFNSAITIVEGEIIKVGLREKYLEVEGNISTVANQADYTLPTDMIDTKIRKVIYNNGTKIYEVRPLFGEDVYEYELDANLSSANEAYYYRIIKDAATRAWKFRLLPKASATVSNGIKVWYFQDLNRYDEDDTECDVPEICYEFVLSYVRYKCYKKENHINSPLEMEELKMMKEALNEVLKGQVADPNVEKIDMDTSSYQESS